MAVSLSTFCQHQPSTGVSTAPATAATTAIAPAPPRFYRNGNSYYPINTQLRLPRPPAKKRNKHKWYNFTPRREQQVVPEEEKVSVVAETVNVTGQTSAQQFKVPPCRLSEDLSALFESKQFSDCTLVATCKSNGPQTFHVNSFEVRRYIMDEGQFRRFVRVHIRGPSGTIGVFHAMFEHNMTESERNEVAIDDVEPDVSAKLNSMPTLTLSLS
ncbi:hypothetical protein COOONC_21248 [Cooperia oncophora]